MKQITSATELIRLLKAAKIPEGVNGVPFALWAPGDHTLYRVSLITMWPADRDSELPTSVGLCVTMNDDVIIIPRPRSEHVQWTPERFFDKFTISRIGWWPGVRPLLATLEWTASGHRSINFQAADWSGINRLASGFVS